MLDAKPITVTLRLQKDARIVAFILTLMGDTWNAEKVIRAVAGYFNLDVVKRA